jgi:septal ring factor EnvC (AmiA/AmiB activator)
MSRAQKSLSVLVVACLGLWGCAQGATNGHASAERVRALEAKLAKFEDDLRAAGGVRDQLRKQVASIEQEKSQLAQQLEQLQAAVKERDELRQQLTLRTSERDSIQSQFEQFRNGIKSLLGQIESPGTLNSPVVSSTSE